MVNASAMPGTSFDEFTGVVAVRSTNDDHHIAVLRQIYCGVLPLLRRLADGVHEAHFGFREGFPKELDQMADAFDRLRGLRHDTETLSRLEFGHVCFRKHDIKLGEI